MVPIIKLKFLDLLKRVDPQVLIITTFVFVMGIIVYAVFMPRSDKPINPEAFAPLLNLIAEGESNDNYNAYFGNPKNQEIDFTSMTVAEVMTWQKEIVRRGNPSSAVGRYQIINTELANEFTPPLGGRIYGYEQEFQTKFLLPAEKFEIRFISVRKVYEHGQAIHLYGEQNLPFSLGGGEVVHAYSKEHDDYFVKSNAKCEKNQITIEMTGADNDTSAKRISIYKEITTITAMTPNQLLVEIKREVHLVNGKLTYRGYRRYHLQKI